MQLIPGLNNTISIIAVHNKDKTLGVLEIVPPQRSDLSFQLFLCQNLGKYLVDNGNGNDILVMVSVVESEKLIDLLAH